MTARRTTSARARRLLITGAVLNVGLLIGFSPPANAAVTSSFSTAGVLTVFGDNLDNTITISRNAAGSILVNGGAVKVTGGSPSVANVHLIQVFGQGGNDAVTLVETSGALPRANLFGGAGNDTLTGGSGADMLFGQSNNDTVLGKGGSDAVFGGSENDTLTGGDADDKVFGESGDDRMIWNPGDDTDLNEGGAGTDAVEVNGGGPEAFTATANGTRVRFDRVNPAPFSIDIGTSEKLVLNAGGSNDTFSTTGNLAPLIGITVDGGTGNDSIVGSNGVDTLRGGDGNDLVDGQQGNDVAFLGAGDDDFQWDPGDGSDSVEGQVGADELVFNGSAAAEGFEASPNGARLRFTRNLASIVIDANDVEVVDLRASGGTDTVTVNDLSGTDVVAVDTDLAATIGGTAGDAQADTIIVNGTNGDDDVHVAGAGTSVSVTGLASQVNVTRSEGANDALVVNTLAGADDVRATTLPAGVIKLTVDGGAANDALFGSQGADVFLGGSGNDHSFGDNGNDVALLGANDDVFQWEPGDGNDTVEGQDGTDSMLFFGANIAETVNIGANSGRVVFTRNVANVVMDLDGVERVDYRALGGADTITVGDLTGTDLVTNGLDLRGSAGGGDGQPDTITVNGTQGAEVLGTAGDAGGVNVFGLHAAVNIFAPEQAHDRLVLNGQNGDDTTNATSLEADGIQLSMHGGLGDDTFFGGQGNDLITGGDGDDLALMGAGDDNFVWNPGDDLDTLEGQAGFDTMVFNGGNVAERVSLVAKGGPANAGRVLFTRDVASVVMDLNDLESVDVNALGGADHVVVNDLTGTDVTEVTANLASTSGAGDGQADNVVTMGTNGEDRVLLAGDSSGTSVFGLAAIVHLVGGEATLDRVTVNALADDDVIDGTGLEVGAVRFTGDGGDGNDVLAGGDGNDTLLGRAGDDVLVGGPGTDILDGGPGDDFVTQN